MNKLNIGLALQIIIPLMIIVIVILVYPYSTSQSVETGKKKYMEHCSNCHGVNGEGLRKLIPPIGDPVHLKLESLACMIRYGKSGIIEVNANIYSGEMPGNFELENDEIAAIMNYLYQSFPDSVLPKSVTLKEVNDVLENCKSK
jgi:mono/diheme cytochrome c family protein